jgi:hypothetical protein
VNGIRVSYSPERKSIQLTQLEFGAIRRSAFDPLRSEMAARPFVQGLGD